MKKDISIGFMEMITTISVFAILVFGIRGCQENQQKQYIECVKSMHGHTGEEVNRTCNRLLN